jgi:hypothetical protein
LSLSPIDGFRPALASRHRHRKRTGFFAGTLCAICNESSVLWYVSDSGSCVDVHPDYCFFSGSGTSTSRYLHCHTSEGEALVKLPRIPEINLPASSSVASAVLSGELRGSKLIHGGQRTLQH